MTGRDLMDIRSKIPGETLSSPRQNTMPAISQLSAITQLNGHLQFAALAAGKLREILIHLTL